jgi:hypothetical protein
MIKWWYAYGPSSSSSTRWVSCRRPCSRCNKKNQAHQPAFVARVGLVLCNSCERIKKAPPTRVCSEGGAPLSCPGVVNKRRPHRLAFVARVGLRCPIPV